MLLDGPNRGKPGPRAKRAAAGLRTRLRRCCGDLCGRCLVCGTRSPAALCAGCFRDLPWNEPACPRCAAPLPALAGAPCGACARRPPEFAAAYAAFAYAWPVDRLLRAFKFRGRLAIGRALALALADYVCAHAPERPDLVIPVPLHRTRLAARGFDQASEIARPLAHRLGRPAEPLALRRVRATAAQSGLGRTARRRNLRRAFECRHPVAGLHVAVVDDVVTTGSTAEAAAVALDRAGARRVTLYALARA